MKLNSVLIILIICFFTNCEKKNNKSTSHEKATNEQLKILDQNQIDVEARIIKANSFNKQILSNGVIEARQKSNLRFKTSNRLASIRVVNGQRVAEGQTLATLDNDLLANQVEKARIDLEKSKSRLEEEKINYGLANIKNDEIEPQILKSLQIKSGFFEAQNTFENAQLLFEQTILKAPFMGVVANLENREGDYITSGDIFCMVINQSQMEAVFSIMESEVPFVQKNQSINITPFASDAIIYNGMITEINPVVGETGLVKLKARIEKPDASLLDGMNVKIAINQKQEDIITIPKEALVLRSNREVVFTTEKGLAKWNYVNVKDENSSNYAISNGLKIGDTVITSNNINLAHDTKVNVKLISVREEGN